MEERYLSLSEAADALDISERTAYRWIKSGKLHAYKPGRDYRIPETAIKEAVEKGEVSPQPSVSSQPSFNGLLEEEERSTAWESATENARRLREDGQGRMAELLSTWRASKKRGDPYAARRGYLDAVGTLLQQAYDAETALVAALSSVHLADQWPEVQKADRFYVELWRRVQEAGLSIRTDGEQADEHTQSEMRPDRVEEPRAA
jgi:excisionase family DNA binding protein